MSTQILIVENSAEYRDMLQEIVEGIGYQTLVASKAAEAVRILEDNIISLILLDIKMPAIHGHQFLKHIRKQGKRMPVIVISGYLTPDILEVLQDNGVANVLVKPVTVRRVAQEVAKVLGEGAAA